MLRALASRSTAHAARSVTALRSARLVHTEQRIKDLGIELPVMTVPLANYTSFVQTGNLVFLSGHIPFKDVETKRR